MNARNLLAMLPVMLLMHTMLLANAPAEILSPAHPLTPDLPQTAAPQPGPALKVLSWNIYMLPKAVKNSGKAQRAALIAELLGQSEYQILVFQEAFMADARRIIQEALAPHYPYAYGPANNRPGLRINSGIWVLSRIPLKVLDEVTYSKCKGIADCMARKGVMLLEGEFGGTTFQIAGTHLQSIGPQAVRKSQYTEIRSLLDKHRRNNVPQIICGDMNTDQADTNCYHDMLQTLDAEDGPLDINISCNDKGCFLNDFHPGGVYQYSIIDYALYRGNGHKARGIRRYMPEFKRRWHRDNQDLSDHFPVAVEVRL
ncbi:MAG: sphingomyelin phosphodiesterase [Bacteroidia bacterium]